MQISATGVFTVLVSCTVGCVIFPSDTALCKSRGGWINNEPSVTSNMTNKMERKCYSSLVFPDVQWWVKKRVHLPPSLFSSATRLFLHSKDASLLFTALGHRMCGLFWVPLTQNTDHVLETAGVCIVAAELKILIPSLCVQVYLLSHDSRTYTPKYYHGKNTPIA